jgi:hypothetical protein
MVDADRWDAPWERTSIVRRVPEGGSVRLFGGPWAGAVIPATILRQSYGRVELPGRPSSYICYGDESVIPAEPPSPVLYARERLYATISARTSFERDEVWTWNVWLPEGDRETKNRLGALAMTVASFADQEPFDRYATLRKLEMLIYLENAIETGLLEPI